MELFKEEFANEQVLLPEIKRPCAVCKKDSPYQCPKCKWFYCNLQCYQKHNLNCTEEFYKENVIQHLKGKKVSKEEAKKMQKILDKVKEKEDDLECLSDAQHQRFEELLDLLEQGELTLDSLKPAELQQFSMFLSDKNNLQGLIKEWEPWWENEDFVYNLDIEELSQAPPQLDNEKEDKLFIYRQELKEKYNKLPPFNKLLAQDPSPELINHIVQFIFSCAYLCREYNGDLKNCCDTVVPSLMAIAKCLHEKVTLPSVQISLDTTLANVMYIDGKDAAPFIEIALTDLAKILENRFYIFEVCFRFYDVVHRYYEYLENMIQKQEKDQKAVAKCQAEKKKISALKQKLLFYLSYLRTRTSDEFNFIKNEVKLYTRERMKNEALHQEMEKIVRNYDQNIRIH